MPSGQYYSNDMFGAGRGGSIAILLQANYSNISNQSVINISTYTPASPATLTTTIGSCKLSANIAQCLSTLDKSTILVQI